MAKRQKTDNRVISDAQKEHRMFEPLEAELQLLLPPKLFSPMLEICKLFLTQQRNDQPSRDLIGRLAFTFRQECLARFGHDSLETFALAKLLDETRRPPGFTPPPPKLDAISHIQEYGNRLARLDASQEDAVNHIKSIWEAFSKFRDIAGGGFGSGGGGRSQILSPMDVMGEDIYKHHRTIYKPWYEVASRIPVARRSMGGNVTVAAITFRIIIEDVYPEDLDQSYALVKGSALKVFKLGLDAYFDPPRLWALLKPAPEASAPPKSAVVGGHSGSGPSKAA